MSVLTLQNVGFTVGANDIFSGITASLTNDGKVGLIGPNGVGKTTLMRMISAVTTPSTGSIHLSQGTRVGYLRQEAVEAFTGREHTVYDEMLTAFDYVRAQEDELRRMEVQMSQGQMGEDLMHRYGTMQEAFERAGGYDFEVRVRQVLDGLGFPRSRWQTSVGHLSGGQKTRALLARLLLERPTLLILDEPTNHLDIQAVEWLEKALHTWDGALLIASHDRFFLDKVVDRIWEMSPAHIDLYRGNYTAYAQQREERWERNAVIYERTMERLSKEMEVIRRYHAWHKFDEANGRLKRLARELLAIEQYGMMAAQTMDWGEVGIRSSHAAMTREDANARIKAIKPISTRPPRVHLALEHSGRSGHMVLTTKDLAVGYERKPLFTSDNLVLERQDRAALIGPNGAGKTTFLRTILGQMPPVSGTVELGVGLKPGYFAQAHDGLDPNRTVVEELRAHRVMLEGEARAHLAPYLFRGDDVWKPVRALSGGERGRLALAILALEGVNLLLLDEPTNHLDIPAQEVLQEALERFDGTIILVSHDRYLVDRLASQVWEIHDGRLHRFKGTYAELMASREAPAPLRAEPVDIPVAAQSNGRASPDKQARKQERRIALLEGQIAEAELAVHDCGRRLHQKAEDGDLSALTGLTHSYEEAQAHLDSLLSEWTDLAATT
jgi:ATP-binding cassette, subfamily F, member 3